MTAGGHPRVLVAGATGSIGAPIVRRLLTSGFAVRAAGRNPAKLASLGVEDARGCDLRRPETLAGIAEGCHAVISAAGARMTLSEWADRASFEDVDHRGNAALLEQAVRARVQKFVYVSVAGALTLRHTAYVQAHERFVHTLAASGLEYCVVRPTGVFAFFLELLAAARRGPLPALGEGLARTNPIHEDDVAKACVEALSAEHRQFPVGGPETFTRARLLEMMFEAHGKPPKLRSMPAWLLRGPARVMGPLQPRLAGLIEFGLAVSQADVIAPAYGALRLGDYLRTAAGGR